MANVKGRAAQSREREAVRRVLNLAAQSRAREAARRVLKLEIHLGRDGRVERLICSGKRVAPQAESSYSGGGRFWDLLPDRFDTTTLVVSEQDA